MPIVMCQGCDELRDHEAHGLCKRCYQRRYYAEHPKKAADRPARPIPTRTFPHRTRMASTDWQPCGGTFRFDHWYDDPGFGLGWQMEAVMRCDRCRLAGLVPAVR